MILRSIDICLSLYKTKNIVVNALQMLSRMRNDLKANLRSILSSKKCGMHSESFLSTPLRQDSINFNVFHSYKRIQNSLWMSIWERYLQEYVTLIIWSMFLLRSNKFIILRALPKPWDVMKLIMTDNKLHLSVVALSWASRREA